MQKIVCQGKLVTNSLDLKVRVFVFLSMGKFIYMVEKHLNNQIKAIRQCRTIWDSIYLESKDLENKAWDKYCDCYQKELKNDSQFELIQNQLEKIVEYVEH
jgi:hypothetical protein